MFLLRSQRRGPQEREWYPDALGLLLPLSYWDYHARAREAWYTGYVSPALAASVLMRDALVSIHGPPLFEFKVLGDPRGFLVSRGFNKASRKAWAWAKTVRRAALPSFSKAWQELCSVEYLYKKNGDLKEERISFPFLATSREGARYFVQTVAFFRNGTHADPENVHKLLKDSLFYKVKRGDKYTGGIYADPIYDKENPRVEVWVWKTKGEPK